MVKPSPVMTGPMQAEVFWNLEAGSGASELLREPSSLKVGNRVVFVRPALASQENRRAELIVSLISRAYIYCKDLQTGEIQVFNRQHYHVAGCGWLEPVGEQPQAEPLLLQGHSYAPGQLSDVLEAEARQGRAVAVVIQHRGGWAVSGGKEAEAR